MTVLPALDNAFYLLKLLKNQTNTTTTTITFFILNISRRKCILSHCFRVFSRTVFNLSNQTFIHPFIHLSIRFYANTDRTDIGIVRKKKVLNSLTTKLKVTILLYNVGYQLISLFYALLLIED